MALQTSGAISLADIQTEFGGSNPISLSEYYAGGSYVPSSSSGTYGSVPTSGAISFQIFYGTTKATTEIFSYTGSAQTFTMTVNKTYKFKLWGAGGIGHSGRGGHGGYTESTVIITTNATGASTHSVYIRVGQASYIRNNAFNFGGGRRSYSDGGIYGGGDGGGASSVQPYNFSAPVLVAGGGGGGGYDGDVTAGGYYWTPAEKVRGGNGGGLIGGSSPDARGGGGGTQTAAGSKIWTYVGNGSGHNGPPDNTSGLGTKGLGINNSGGRTSSGWTGGGGGGGWWGGNAGYGTDYGYYPTLTPGHGGGGGGSGWVGASNNTNITSSGSISGGSALTGTNYGSESSYQDTTPYRYNNYYNTGYGAYETVGYKNTKCISSTDTGGYLDVGYDNPVPMESDPDRGGGLVGKGLCNNEWTPLRTYDGTNPGHGRVVVQYLPSGNI